ncbi:FxsA family protein [Nocardioides sp. WL0053]|jgi:UPF0716 protein FxsA|uniref:FxsA family protein n=1 Tax=Nocardioides jiangsuensis TaxID=2866161 RepID=A0ABS7RE71_9ACTN|nr:FxsA family protein [Nocardioides jiangsuensis]MBY9073311.1 FxsA family protein [Nocardioides jiangsuensis]
MRRRFPWSVLAVLFVVVPIVEIYLLIQVGQAIGGWTTVGLLVLDSILGAYLVKREGGRAWEALQDALQSRRMPARELADGALILVGGTLLLTPGFVTDVFGFFCILPFTRPVARRLLTAFITRRFLGGPSGSRGGTQTGGRRHEQSGAEDPRTRRRPGPDSSVVQGEVVD